MIVEIIDKNKVLITKSNKKDNFGFQRLIDYAKYLEITSQSQAKQSEIDKLADKVNEDWWFNNKHRFIK